MKVIIVSISFFLFFNNAFSQSCLSNSDIILMCRDSVNTGVVLTKIEKSDCCFDIASSDIVDLTKNKVPPSVIEKMINSMGDHKRTNARARSPRVPKGFSKRKN